MGKNIAVYGGAFNPPTLGHEHVVKNVFTYATGVDKIILVPDGLRHDKEYGISIKHRKALAELFYIYLSKEGYKVDLDTYFLEGRNGGNTTTMEVVKYFESLYGDGVKHIFGSDVVPYMKDWVGNEKQYVEKKLQKIFISRGGYFFQNNEILNYEYIETPPLDISSTLVRGCIATKKKVNNLLMPEISEYIKNNNIYKK